jgi:hypothetical protein
MYVRPLGGGNFTRPDWTPRSRRFWGGRRRSEKASAQGIEEQVRQELHRAAVRAETRGGGPGKSCIGRRCEQRHGGGEAEPLDEDGMALGDDDGEKVAMAVKELPPLVWRTFTGQRACVALSA